MRGLGFLDFELAIAPRGGGVYRAEIVRSPAGESTHEFRLVPGEDDIENQVRTVILRRAHARGQVRDLAVPEPAGTASELEVAKTLGVLLFDRVIGGEILASFRMSRAKAREQGSDGLRIILRLDDVPELATLPWELMRDPKHGSFLSQSPKTPIVRHVRVPEPVEPLSIQLPLSILVVISRPAGHTRLAVQRERDNLEKALAPLYEKGLVQVRYLERATPMALRRVTRNERFQVLHYIGHGGFAENDRHGVLVFEDEDGSALHLSGQRLATLLGGFDSIRLVVLNACEGARSSLEEPFSSVATALIQRGVPAVIAMQFEITDDSAIAFSDELYTAVAEGRPIDAAVTEARIRMASLSYIEWCTPVLFMRTRDGRLFELEDLQGASDAQDETLAGIAQPSAVQRHSEPGSEPDDHTAGKASSAWKRPLVLASVLLAVSAIVVLELFADRLLASHVDPDGSGQSSGQGGHNGQTNGQTHDIRLGKPASASLELVPVDLPKDCARMLSIPDGDLLRAVEAAGVWPKDAWPLRTERDIISARAWRIQNPHDRTINDVSVTDESGEHHTVTSSLGPGKSLLLIDHVDLADTAENADFHRGLQTLQSRNAEPIEFPDHQTSYAGIGTAGCIPTLGYPPK